MNQKSSIPQSAQSVSEVLTPDSQIAFVLLTRGEGLPGCQYERRRSSRIINVHFFNERYRKKAEYMEKPGRRSVEDLSVVSLASVRKPIEPPKGLKPQEEAIFVEVVAACSPDHFRKSDIPMLTAFATATHLSRFYATRIGESDGALKAWEAATRVQISLSTKLRLTPSTRLDPKTVHRHVPVGDMGKAPWED
jgi:hypothetical protein